MTRIVTVAALVIGVALLVGCAPEEIDRKDGHVLSAVPSGR